MKNAIAWLALSTLAACGGGSPPPPATPPTPPAKAPEASTTVKSDGPVAPPAAAGPVGRITGTVKVESKHRITKAQLDPACAAMHPDGLPKDDSVVDDQNNLRWAFVYLSEGATGSHAPPPTPVVLDQKGCRYDPHVFGMIAGQMISIRNSDTVAHNVHGLPMLGGEFNVMQQPGQEDKKTFAKKEVMVFVKCDIHPWMGAWAGVLDHPYFAVTDASGKFAIENVPPGQYTLTPWAEKYAGEPMKIGVKAGAAAEAAFTLKKK